ncbi:MAG TPA: hypothetical protein V6C97_00790, partial [Oculatellaceae cyanobacterium]
YSPEEEADEVVEGRGRGSHTPRSERKPTKENAQQPKMRRGKDVMTRNTREQEVSARDHTHVERTSTNEGAHSWVKRVSHRDHERTREPNFVCANEPS